LKSTVQFTENAVLDKSGYAREVLLNNLCSSGYLLDRVALLSEDNTAWGYDETPKVQLTQQSVIDDKCGKPLYLRFPREISLLRNAMGAGDQGEGATASSSSVPSPYLHLSLKDSSVQDSIPQFDRENTPLSQEAQLMAIARQLQRNRTEFIAIVASTNPLDQIFLAQFLHRALPNARLVFLTADLLLDREIDNVPFVGTLMIT
jgi:hypothetical protein